MVYNFVISWNSLNSNRRGLVDGAITKRSKAESGISITRARIGIAVKSVKSE